MKYTSNALLAIVAPLSRTVTLLTSHEHLENENLFPLKYVMLLRLYLAFLIDYSSAKGAFVFLLVLPLLFGLLSLFILVISVSDFLSH